MWKFLVILSVVALVQGCRVIEEKANGQMIERTVQSSHVLIESFVSYKQKYLCSGVLISADYVLTTAYCLFGAMFVNVHVYAYQLRDLYEEGREIYRSEVYSMRENFDGATHTNDIGLIKLPSTLPIASKSYSIVSLPTAAPVEGTEGQTIGWGLLEFKDDNAADKKQSQMMRIVSNDVCQEAYGLWSEVAGKAGRGCIKRVTGANCVGDSGSPFIVGTTIVGLLSFGQDEACSEAEPNGIQEVFSHVDWIRSVTGIV